MPQNTWNEPTLQLIAVLVTGSLASLLLATLLRHARSRRHAGWLLGLTLLIAAQPASRIVDEAIRARAIDHPRRVQFTGLRPNVEPGVRLKALRALFGEDADPDTLRDVRQEFGIAFAGASDAFATGAERGGTILAQFPSRAAALAGYRGYLEYHGIPYDRTADGSLGVLVSRPAGGRLLALRHRQVVGVFSGATDEVLRGLVRETGIPLTKATALVGEAPARGRIADWVWLWTGFLALGGIVYVVRGLSWAASEPGKASVAPAGAEALARRLEGLNGAYLPVRIRATSPTELTAEWRLDQSTWLELATANRIPHLRRIRIRLDPSRQVARAFEEICPWTQGDRVEGKPTGWSLYPWLLFHRRERNTTPGVRFDAEGWPHSDPASRFTMDPSELRDPMIALITRAGWTWRPLPFRESRLVSWLHG